MAAAWIALDTIDSEKIVEHYGLPIEEVEVFKPYMRVYRRGEQMYAASDGDVAFYLLRQGEAEIVDTLNQSVFSHLASGQVYGSVSFGSHLEPELSIRASSAAALVYALPGPALEELLPDPRWREMLFERLVSSLMQSNRDLIELKIDTNSWGLESMAAGRPGAEADEKYDQLVLRIAKIFSTLLAIIERVKDSVSVTSRAWYYVDTLDQQVMRLLNRYAPDIARKIGDPDPVMLKMSLRRNTGFLNVNHLPDENGDDTMDGA